MEEKSRISPSAYRLKVLGIVGLGFAYLIGILLLLAGSIAALVVGLSGKASVLLVKLVLPLAGLIWMLVRSLRIKFDEPEGIPLTPINAPGLFREISGLASSLRTLRIHKVLLTPEFNASVVQIPRLGLFGWQRNYLMIGLPLLQAMPMNEFRAVLAHEMAHLSRSHSKFHGWIYRVRRAWGQLMDKLEEKDSAWVLLFQRFLDWYSPKLGAYTFVLARDNEYEADRLAADAAGARSVASALLRIRIAGARLQSDFWPGLERRVRGAEPIPAVHSLMGQELAQPQPAAEAERLLREAMLVETAYDDTHPSLRDRLEALQQTASVPDPAYASCLQELLGSSAEELTSRLDDQWKQETADSWAERVESYREMAKEHAELSCLDSDELTDNQLWGLARLEEELNGPTSALPLYERLIARNDRLAHAYAAAGRALMKQEGAAMEAQAAAYLSRAAELDEDYALSAYGELADYCTRIGMAREAEQYRDKQVRFLERLRQGQLERASVLPTDSFVPHGLEAYELAPLTQELRQYPILREAYLVRKVVTHFPNKPKFVLLIRNKRKWRVWSRTLARLMVRNLAKEEALPSGTSIIVLNTSRRFKPVQEQALLHPHGVLFRRESAWTPAAMLRSLSSRRMMEAIAKRRTGAVRFWLAMGADPNRIEQGMLPLSMAANQEDLVTMKLLAEKGARIDEKNEDGNTPLFWAAYQGDEEAVNWLLEQGADPNVRYLTGRSVLSAVCMHGHAAVLKILLNAGARPIYTCHADGETPLMIAAYNGHAECASLLLAAGADPEVRDKHGNTALSFAKDCGHESVVQALLDHASQEQPA
ncbi:ankyrin repeat domain-containing protein [Paenibacillus sp. FSL W8-1187]|uniref:ankyrin repeat domain-containing protein n=1 Tax=Paenibacillus TaxID=44249 RepID=UPI000FDA2759|nr:ankyrin repeat domain-containing protein [Paenibacillus pasadenensis]